MPRLAPWLTALALCCLMLALPSVSSGALLTFGSVGTSASVAETHGADTAFWVTAPSGGLPVGGQVRKVRIRGCARPGIGGQAPLTEFHIQVLATKAGGGVSVQGTSQPLNLPVCGSGGTPATITTYKTEYLCPAAGDYVDFNDEGGYTSAFPGGVPYQVFAPATGFTTLFYSADGETNNGDSLTGSPLSGVQLLMQVVLGTGRNKGIICRYI
jgi:hypothetical protein